MIFVTVLLLTLASFLVAKTKEVRRLREFKSFIEKTYGTDYSSGAEERLQYLLSEVQRTLVVYRGYENESVGYSEGSFYFEVLQRCMTSHRTASQNFMTYYRYIVKCPLVKLSREAKETVDKVLDISI
jgi:hypothetical protein